MTVGQGRNDHDSLRAHLRSLAIADRPAIAVAVMITVPAGYFRAHQPPTLVTWGKGDEIFGPAGAEAYRRDLPDAEIHLLETGHFALEDDVEFIADKMRHFLRENVVSRPPEL